MTFGLVHASYSLPFGQAVKLTFFVPCRGDEEKLPAALEWLQMLPT